MNHATHVIENFLSAVFDVSDAVLCDRVNEDMLAKKAKWYVRRLL